ncbi:MAG: SGNH/GDSL hydrolase family protein [Chloroflexi bacterium]|nr:SGNH/GDSL hydrolase family protein [Chloroflexota bacterium]
MTTKPNTLLSSIALILFFVVLIAVIIGAGVFVMLSSRQAEPESVVVIVVQDTPTSRFPTLPPLWTNTPTLTLTPTRAPTLTRTPLTPSRTPSVTPTLTPSLTFTPSPTPTITLTPTLVVPTQPPAAANGYVPPLPPNASRHAREIYARGLAAGNNPHAFSKVGDCHSTFPNFLGEYDTPNMYNLSAQYDYLRATIIQFKGSFAHESMVASNGDTLDAMLDPKWANPNVCKSGETPLECEVRTHKPSIMFVSLGTNEFLYTSDHYESQMRRLIYYLLDHGVVPIIATKADNREFTNYLNPINARLAKEYEVPFWDFWSAVQSLPNHGLAENYIHLSYSTRIFYFDDPAALQLGWTIRNLTGLQALDAVWRGVRQ